MPFWLKELISHCHFDLHFFNAWHCWTSVCVPNSHLYIWSNVYSGGLPAIFWWIVFLILNYMSCVCMLNNAYICLYLKYFFPFNRMNLFSLFLFCWWFLLLQKAFAFNKSSHWFILHLFLLLQRTDPKKLCYDISKSVLLMFLF